jgi:hypothetical protein
MKASSPSSLIPSSFYSVSTSICPFIFKKYENRHCDPVPSIQHSLVLGSKPRARELEWPGCAFSYFTHFNTFSLSNSKFSVVCDNYLQISTCVASTCLQPYIKIIIFILNIYLPSFTPSVRPLAYNTHHLAANQSTHSPKNVHPRANPLPPLRSPHDPLRHATLPPLRREDKRRGMR